MGEHSLLVHLLPDGSGDIYQAYWLYKRSLKKTNVPDVIAKLRDWRTHWNEIIDHPSDIPPLVFHETKVYYQVPPAEGASFDNVAANYQFLVSGDTPPLLQRQSDNAVAC